MIKVSPETLWEGFQHALELIRKMKPSHVRRRKIAIHLKNTLKTRHLGK